MTIYQKLNNLFPTDESIEQVKQYLTNNIIPDTENERKFKEKYNNFIVENDELIFKPLNLIVVPTNEINNILNDEYHKNNVIGKGLRTFYKYIISKYINIKRKDIDNFMKSNQHYQMTRPIVHHINKPIMAKFPNQLWGIDLIDLNPYAKQNYRYRYIITVCDIFSRKIWLDRSTEKTAEYITNIFNNICVRANVKPNHIMSDNGAEFQGEFSEYCKENNIKQRFIRSQTPQANGVVERKNQEIRKILRTLLLHNNTLKWVDFIDDIEDNINNTYSNSIKATPNEIWTEDKELLKDKIKNHSSTFINDPKKYKQVQSQETLTNIFKNQIQKFKNIDDFEVGQPIRIKMSSIFANVRKLVKDKLTKQIIITYTPEIFYIHKVLRSNKSPLERKRYVIANDKDQILNVGDKQSIKYFFGSELLPVYNLDDPINNIDMKRALLLNKVDTNKNDVNY